MKEAGTVLRLLSLDTVQVRADPPSHLRTGISGGGCVIDSPEIGNPGFWIVGDHAELSVPKGGEDSWDEGGKRSPEVLKRTSIKYGTLL